MWRIWGVAAPPAAAARAGYVLPSAGSSAMRASVARAPIRAGGPGSIASWPRIPRIETTVFGLSRPSFMRSSRSTPPAFSSASAGVERRAASGSVAG